MIYSYSKNLNYHIFYYDFFITKEKLNYNLSFYIFELIF
jgi:hypothetical protein